MRFACTIPGPPVPKERPRRDRRGRWYTPSRTRRYERHVRSCVSASLLRETAWPIEAEYDVHLELYLPDRRARDVDNIAKAILDGATRGGLWEDDRQVVKVTVIRRLDREAPRAEMRVEVLS